MNPLDTKTAAASGESSSDDLALSRTKAMADCETCQFGVSVVSRCSPGREVGGRYHGMMKRPGYRCSSTDCIRQKKRNLKPKRLDKFGGVEFQCGTARGCSSPTAVPTRPSEPCSLALDLGLVTHNDRLEPRRISTRDRQSMGRWLHGHGASLEAGQPGEAWGESPATGLVAEGYPGWTELSHRACSASQPVFPSISAASRQVVPAACLAPFVPGPTTELCMPNRVILEPQVGEVLVGRSRWLEGTYETL